MDAKHLIILALQVSIVSLVFGFGLRTTFADLVRVLRTPLLLLRAVIAVFVVMPLFALLVVKVAPFSRTAEFAFVALSLSPMPPLLPRRIGKAHGDVGFSIALLVVLACLSIVTIPISLWLIEQATHQGGFVAPGRIAKIVVVMIVLPLFAGMTVRKHWPGAVPLVEKIASVITWVLMPLAGVVLLVALAPMLWAALGMGAMLAIGAFVAFGLAVGHYLGAPNPDLSTDLALATACRHPAIALTIATAASPGGHFGATIALYLLASVLFATPYVLWMKRRAASRTDAHP
jgi:bile acid:Na+ symporter, BASS family